MNIINFYINNAHIQCIRLYTNYNPQSHTRIHARMRTNYRSRRSSDEHPQIERRIKKITWRYKRRFINSTLAKLRLSIKLYVLNFNFDDRTPVYPSTCRTLASTTMTIPTKSYIHISFVRFIIFTSKKKPVNTNVFIAGSRGVCSSRLICHTIYFTYGAGS